MTGVGAPRNDRGGARLLRFVLLRTTGNCSCIAGTSAIHGGRRNEEVGVFF